MNGYGGAWLVTGLSVGYNLPKYRGCFEVVSLDMQLCENLSGPRS